MLITLSDENISKFTYVVPQTLGNIHPQKSVITPGKYFRL